MTDASTIPYLNPTLRRELDALIAAAREGRPVALPELAGGSRGLFLAWLARLWDGPMLLIAADDARAAELARDLEFFAGDGMRHLANVPSYDVSPYESVSPNQRLVHERLDALHRLLSAPKQTLAIVTAEAACHRLVPRSFLADARIDLAVGDEIDRDDLTARLVEWGYQANSLTEDVGDFSIRGSLVDVFPPTADHPIRIDLMGDRIEQMRTFFPANQRTKDEVHRATLLPCREIAFTDENRERFALAVKALADSLSLAKAKRDALVADVRAGIYFPGIEFLLPLFYGSSDTLFDYLNPQALVVCDEWTEIARRAAAFADKVAERHRRSTETRKLTVPPDQRYLSAEDLAPAIGGYGRVYLGLADPLLAEEPAQPSIGTRSTGDLHDTVARQDVSARMLEPVADRIRAWSRETGGKPFVVCSGRAGIERMRALLTDYGLRIESADNERFADLLASRLHEERTITLVDGELRHGFVWDDLGLMVVTEQDLFGEKKRRVVRTRPRASQVISSFGDLTAGDFIVHLLHGIGIYRGLVALSVGDVPGEFLLLEYAEGDKLYLPVDRLSMVQRYSGGEGAVPRIDKLGGSSWEKTKAKAKAGAQRMAKELLALYAKRHAKPGFSFVRPEPAFSEFEATFPYQETPDQAATIAEVLADLEQPRPMDRLVCGDVGFGKTEVALRAAYLAAMNGKQVAVLVPTTTLAFQHWRTFRDRLTPFGAKVAMLSRFVDGKKRKEVLAGVADGQVDVVIGTHQLLGKAVRFHDLGLLVIDEEQHFGVAQKEKIKRAREMVDVLTLTATPIPRTFNMSLSGIRDMSIINTPPEDRLAVRTLITRFEDDTVREAITRELGRGGQTFFIHNRVRTIHSVADRLRGLVPEASMAVGHGQMPKEELERIMIDFADQKINLLVSTAIIESGLDFPLANTILIDRADAFGLAQLYQLRGRVGRSERRAYAYLLIPGERVITADARRRLAVLRNFTELGSGFKIAAHDLEIRGAGNLLGSEQSGHIHAVGFEMYHKLLEEAIAELRGEQIEEAIQTEVNLRLPAYIPTEYIPDERVRLAFYKRLSEAAGDDEAAALSAEMADRFGEIPEPLANLFAVLDVKRIAAGLRIRSIDLGTAGLVLKFDEETPVSPARIVELVAAEPARFHVSPDGSMMIRLSEKDRRRLVRSVKKRLQELV